MLLTFCEGWIPELEFLQAATHAHLVMGKCWQQMAATQT